MSTFTMTAFLLWIQASLSYLLTGYRVHLCCDLFPASLTVYDPHSIGNQYHLNAKSSWQPNIVRFLLHENTKQRRTNVCAATARHLLYRCYLISTLQGIFTRNGVCFTPSITL